MIFLWVVTSECIDCPFQQKDELTVICHCISGLSRYSSSFRNIWVDSTFRFLPLAEIEAVMLFATHCSDLFLWVWFSVWDICSDWKKIDWEFIVTAPVNSQTTLTLKILAWQKRIKGYKWSSIYELCILFLASHQSFPLESERNYLLCFFYTLSWP